MSDQKLRHLPLEEMHKALGAKMVPFAGWNMPVQYKGIAVEHYAVRTKVGIFDVSHMGQIMIYGNSVVDFLNTVSTNDITKITNGRAQYGLLLNPQGGVIDDIINYKISDSCFFICVNASNTEEDYQWLTKQAALLGFNDLKIENLSDRYVQIAVQGPYAMTLLSSYFEPVSDSLKRFNFLIDERFSEHDLPCIIARTGYSGEDGCEIFVSTSYGKKIWEGLCATSIELDIEITPCGLGARDTLRLEACYPLHGHEIRPDITPLSARLDKFLSFTKDFIGAPALMHQKQLGISPMLVGLCVQGAGIMRADYPVVKSERTVGWVTSGTMIPQVPAGVESPKSRYAGRSIGLALVLPDYTEIGSQCVVKFREKDLHVEIIETPFIGI